LAQKVDTALRQHPGPPFVRVSAAFLEFSKPNIADAVAELTQAGADTVFVLPLFVAPSSHTLRDLPNVLGHTADLEILAQLADEGTKIVHTRAHVIVGPTLAYGDFLQRALVRQTAALSKNPDSEAVVILAHGDEDFAPIWEKMLTRAGSAVCGRTGITWFDFATIETGQTFLQNGLPVIRQALDARSRVLVLGLYVNLPASRIAERYRDKLFGAAGSLRGRDV
ncbi:MAG: hypothetical protein GXO73_13570, partial [Calditrichaeota bacterium]|nr:hypothetical protein [Calditrichota bacterium]